MNAWGIARLAGQGAYELTSFIQEAVSSGP